MSTSIGPGDWVECVEDAEGCEDGCCREILKGEIVRIAVLEAQTYDTPCDSCGDTETVLNIEGDQLNPQVHGGRCLCCFRPMRRNPDLIQSLLTPIGEQVEV